MYSHKHIQAPGCRVDRPLPEAQTDRQTEGLDTPSGPPRRPLHLLASMPATLLKAGWGVSVALPAPVGIFNRPGEID